MGFRKDFVWGVAASAFQTEGEANKDGKGDSIWDVFMHEKNGKIYENMNADMATDFYHRYKEDIKLMRELGVKAYRFSLNWPRILPDGTGKINEKGIAFYNDMINELLANGIEPYITLFHWEYPYALHRKGGWLNDDSPEWFAEYARVVTENFSDRVTKFITFNEPQCFVGLGYNSGDFAPGEHHMYHDQFIMAHNVLKAHGLAVQAIRAAAKQKVEVGYAPTGQISYPETTSAEDIEAARIHQFDLFPDMTNWTWNLSWWMDPVLLGHYPQKGLKLYEQYLPDIKADDMKLINQPLDFLGQNIYNGHMVRMGADGNYEIADRYPGYPKTSVNWPVTYECLYWGPKFITERYGKIPFYITENGMGCNDTVSLDGKVHDPDRIDFLHRYIGRLRDAVNDGVDVRGYFEWAFTDNFEWQHGYNERFGLVYVDYRDQTRIPKDSYYWFRDIVNTNGEKL